MTNFKEKFNEYIKGLTKGEIKHAGKRLGLSAIQNYASCYKHYDAFTRREPSLYLEDVDLYNFTNRKDRIAAKKKSNDHFNRFLGYLQKQGISVSSQQIYIAKLKTVIFWLKDEDMVEINISNVSVSQVKKETVVWDNYMTEIILDAAPKTDIEILFQLQIHLCCRWSELQSIDAFEKSYLDGNIVYMASLRQDKTGQRVKPIIPKDMWELAKPLFQLKTMYNGEYNKRLKDFLKRFPEFNEEIVFSEQRPDGSIHTKKKKWYEFASSHDLRRAGINRLQVMGVPDEMIRNMYSGHKSVEVFNRHYVGINREKMADVANKIQ